MEMTKLVWFTISKNVLGQTLYGNTLRPLLDDGFDRLKMALHPIVVYHKEGSKLAHAAKLFVVFLTILNMTLNLVLRCNAN